MPVKDDGRRVDLCGAWSMACTANPPEQDLKTIAALEGAGLEILPAAVPGNLELDLQAAGKLPEPFHGLNILKVRELESHHLWLWRRFETSVPEGAVPRLVFEGIDCFADIYLNGELMATFDNMLIEQGVDAAGKLQADNELVVHIKPAMDMARTYDYGPGLNAGIPNYPSLYVRKAPHMYGWDIMPRALSAGLWRPVRLEYISPPRIENVYMETSHLAADHGRADLRLYFQARLDDCSGGQYGLRIRGSCGTSSFEAEQELIFDVGHIGIGLDDPCLWWPAGRGEPHLYDIEVELLRTGELIDRMVFKHGIRMVELVRTSTTSLEGEGEFVFVVNGEKVFAKGTNWVPLDAFHSRDLERTERALALAEEAGCNMIRCWGGNVYESDLFYDTCDARGIMIWQDFAMACALYPQDEDFQRAIAHEVRSVVRRLRQHPAIVLWSGDNENDMAYGWFGRGDPNQNVLTRQVIPDILREEDPGRPYLPSSPYIDEEAYREGAGHAELPENHLWGPRNYYKSDYYRDAGCHFVSEIGYHGCPDPDSVREFISADKLWPAHDNEEWTLHCTDAVPGLSHHHTRVPLMFTQIKELFGIEPDNLEDFAFASQAAQAEAKKSFIELFRVRKWRTTGILWWNLLDGWPQFSDAVVDYYWRRKLAFDYICRAQAPLLLILHEPEDGRQLLSACNDTRDDIDFSYTIRDIGADTLIDGGEGRALADAVSPLNDIAYDQTAQRFYVIEWDCGDTKGMSHYLAGERPFELTQYRGWAGKAGFLRDWMRKDT